MGTVINYFGAIFIWVWALAPCPCHDTHQYVICYEYLIEIEGRGNRFRSNPNIDSTTQRYLYIGEHWSNDKGIQFADQLFRCIQ